MGCLIKYLLVVLGLMSSHIWAISSDYRLNGAHKIQRLSVEQGLSQSVVYDVIQDSQGYVWIATEDGLNRFDGYDFEVFEHRHGDPDSISENLIYTLLEDPAKGLWIGTLNGLSYLDFNTQKFLNYSTSAKFSLASVTALLKAPNGNIFIGAEKGLFLLNSTTQTIQPFVSKDGRRFTTEVFSFAQQENLVWFANANCVYAIDQINFSVRDYCDSNSNGNGSGSGDGDLASLLNQRTPKVIVHNNGVLWIGTTDGLINYDIKSAKGSLWQHDPAHLQSISANWIQDLAFDLNGDLWIGTTNGADRYHFQSGEFEHFQQRIHDNDGLSSSDIISIFADRNGLIWLGSYAGGVNIVDPQHYGFKHILTQSDLFELQASNVIHGITKDQFQNLWLASFGGGLIKLDLMSGKISRPFHKALKARDANYDYVYSLLTDLHHRLWIGTADGLEIADLNQQRLLTSQIYIDDKPADFKDYIFQIYEDHQGKIWLGSVSGFYRVEKTQQLEHHAKSASESDVTFAIYLKSLTATLPKSFTDKSRWVSIIYETRNGDLWLGGQSGLLCYSQQLKTWSHYQYDINQPQSISYDDIQAIFEDSRGILWVGTANGLNKVDRSDPAAIKFQRITKQDGLVNNAIYGVLEDPQHQIWLSTNLGLTRYSERAEMIRSFRKNDGISSDEFNKGAYYTDDEGVLYFGSINGVTLIAGAIEANKQRNDRLKFSEIKLGQRVLDVQPFNTGEVKAVDIFNDDDVLSFSFTDLYYQKLATQRYRYRLNGLDNDWVNLDKERRIFFIKLLKGDYQLEIQSRTAGENWGTQQLSLGLKVEGDFWGSRDALFLGIGGGTLFIIVSLFYIRQYYLSQLKKHHTKMALKDHRLTELVNERNELQTSTEDKSSQIDTLTQSIDDLTEQLNQHYFKDPVTGFYRFNAIQKLMADNQEQQLTESFNFVMLFQITSISPIKQNFGQIAAAELSSEIASQLKQTLPSQVYICQLQDDVLLILSNSAEQADLIHLLTEFRQRILRSQFVIANGKTVQTKIAISYFELFDQKITNYSTLNQLLALLNEVHQKNNHRKLARIIRVEFNETIDNYLVDQLITNPQELLVETNRITLHYL